MISLQQAFKQYGQKIIFNDITVSLQAGDRCGLIGPNGAGKTVMLRVIAGQEELDRGAVSIPADLRIGFLPQEMTVPGDMTPLAYILAPFRRLLDGHTVFEKLAASEEGSAEYHRHAREMDRVLRQQQIHDIYSLESRAQAICAGLGIAQQSWNAPIEQLSGGYRMRVALAALLLRNPDFLLLDEPTNHLDLDSLIWLEKFLQRFDGGLALVSHDRDFLERVANRTLRLAGGALESFNGPLSSYLSWKSQQRDIERRRTKNLSTKIAQTERFIERFKSKATKASQAQSRAKQLERLKEQLPEERTGDTAIHFTLRVSGRSATTPLRFESLDAGYAHAPVISRVHTTVSRGDKIAVIGPNGAGKSTFLKTCAGLLPPRAGALHVGQNTEIRYFSQHRLDQLDPGKTLYDTIAESGASLTRTQIQSILGAFLFTGDEVLKPAAVLSGGEKSRLSLAAILANPGNCLLLDEPTNHLDIQSVERLADVLAGFDGTLIIVSHDEYFLSRVTNRVFEIRDGALRDFPGALSDYREYCERGFSDDQPQSLDSAPPSPSPDRADKHTRMRLRRERKTLERKIETIERRIEEVEAHLAGLKQSMADPALAADYQKLHDLDQRMHQTQSDYHMLLEQWDACQDDLQHYTA